ncbi:MAG: hypothetical protein NTZ43_09980 [Gemmatimonadetes bacterium]|nr:hypothetical protein [Gemmatimonadota bacterium]
MSLSGVNNSLRDALTARLDQTQTRPANGEATRALGTRADSSKLDSAANAQRPAVTASGVQAPAGTDPALWSILTNEERNFFARSASSGPLTYSKVMNLKTPTTNAPPIRGRRLDIRA